MHFALIFLLLFPCPDPTMALRLEELDAFPPAGLLAKWLECADMVWGTLNGRAAEEAEKSRYALYNLHRAQLARERGDPVTARYRWRQVLEYRPEWRFRPYAVEMIPYRWMKKQKQ